MCRHERLKGTPSDVAPILWQHGALARLKKGETIDKLLYGGYSTISLGYAGLYECVKYMTGKSHTDPSATPFAIEVMQHLNDACAKWKEKENIDFHFMEHQLNQQLINLRNVYKNVLVKLKVLQIKTILQTVIISM